MKTPVNDLERAFVAAVRSESALPAFMRLLRESPLSFLTPYHPELDTGEMELKPGSEMSIETFTMRDGTMVPVFTSEGQLRRSLRTMNQSARRFTVMTMDGATLFSILASQPHPVIINPHSELGEAVLQTGTVKKLADGSALRPVTNAGESSPDGGREMSLTILNVADHPTDIIQPVFEYLRQHPIFRAAWIFGLGAPEAWDRKSYQMAVWMEKRDAEKEQDLGVIVKAIRDQKALVEVMIMCDEEVAGLEWTRHIPPFFQRAE